MATNGHVDVEEGRDDVAALAPAAVGGEAKEIVAASEAAVTSIQARRPKPDAGSGPAAATKTRLTAAELDRARKEIIEKQLPPGLPAEVVAALWKLLPDEILAMKKMMELVYAQAAAKAGEEGFKQGADAAGREGFERGKAAMVQYFKPMIAVVNAADSWVDNRPRMAVDKKSIENAEAAQAATMGLVEAVVVYRQMREASPAGQHSEGSSEG